MNSYTLFAYLVAAAFFIVGLKRLNSPATARAGNTVSGIGMTIAVIATLLDHQIVTYGAIIAGVLLGASIGLFMARRAKMTEMPQLVALLHGIGSAAALIVAGAEYLQSADPGADVVPLMSRVATQVSIAIGGLTFTGSIIAFAKLHEIMTGKPILFPGMRFVSGLTVGAIIVAAVMQVIAPVPPLDWFYAAVALSLLLGVLFVLPIGGADMPVVISVLNSSAGVAAAMVGFVIQNPILIVSGSLIGSAGIILSQIMCRAMNRSLPNVLFSAFGTATAKSSKSAIGLSVKSTSAEDAAMQLAYAQLVIVIPGYGLAVAQAQHLVRELADLIEKRGGEVRYAIHPVAGRMPGHMNVVLAEANVPYDKLFEMEAINDEFDRADVALVVGANDVVNPAARTDTSSPIYGMPILNADHAKSCIVLKRGMSAGFAGIENELFYANKTWMLFGDAKASLTKLVAEVKAIA